MRAVALDFGVTPAAASLRTVPVPQPTRGEIRLRVVAASLNPVDGKFAWWSSLLPATARAADAPPFVVGVDAAGVVDGLGEGVTDWAVGDRAVVHGKIVRSLALLSARYWAAHWCDDVVVDGGVVNC
jgi:NADPH:quinone reductase-like Zn-dependent oxidoreductase